MDTVEGLNEVLARLRAERNRIDNHLDDVKNAFGSLTWSGELKQRFAEDLEDGMTMLREASRALDMAIDSASVRLEIARDAAVPSFVPSR